VNAGVIPVDRLRASVRRILELKARLGLHRDRYVSIDSISRIVGSRDHQRAADSAAGREFNRVLRTRTRSLDAVRISPSSDTAIYSDLRRRARASDRVVVSVYLEPQLGVDHQVGLPDAFRASSAGWSRTEGRWSS
jgi:hypothetical protein